MTATELRDEKIRLYMKKLGITWNEALELLADEENDNLPDLTPDQKAVEKEMRQAERKVETTKRTRERKPDEDKRGLIYFLAFHLADGVAKNVNTTNPEREIEFDYNGNHYRLTLSKPRKEK